MTRKQPPCTYSQILFFAISINNTNFAGLGGYTLLQSNQTLSKTFFHNNRRNTSYLGLLFYNYYISALRNCQVVSVLLLDAPEAICFADDMYHIISRTATLQIKNDGQRLSLSISSIQCQACLMQASCNSVISFNQGAFVLHPNVDFH